MILFLFLLFGSAGAISRDEFQNEFISKYNISQDAVNGIDNLIDFTKATFAKEIKSTIDATVDGFVDLLEEIMEDEFITAELSNERVFQEKLVAISANCSVAVPDIVEPTSAAPTFPSTSEKPDEDKPKNGPWRAPLDPRLSAEIAGQFYIKSAHGTYLRAIYCIMSNGGVVNTRAVDVAPHNKTCEQWYIEDKGDGKVLFKTFRSPHRYLRAQTELTVDLADEARKWEAWTPYKHSDGMWSFQSHHGTWLHVSKRYGGHISLRHNNKGDGKFELEDW